MDPSSNLSGYLINSTHDVRYTPAAIAIRSTVVLVVSLAIILSNLINFFILKTTKQMSAVTRVFLANLTTADFWVGLIGCLPAIGPVITGTWPYGVIWCQISGVVHRSSSAVSMWSIGVIGIERYIAIRYPLFYKNKLTPRTTLGIACSVWALGILAILTPNFITGDFLLYKFYPSNAMCGWRSGLKWVWPAIFLLIPGMTGSVIVFTTTSIAKALRQETSTQPGGGTQVFQKRGISQRASSHRKKKAIRLLIVTTGLYFITWGPMTILSSLETLEIRSSSPSWLIFTFSWMASSNCFVNVFIYSAIYPSFRCQLKTLLLKVFCCRAFRPGSRVEPWTTSGSHKFTK